MQHAAEHRDSCPDSRPLFFLILLRRRGFQQYQHHEPLESISTGHQRRGFIAAGPRIERETQRRRRTTPAQRTYQRPRSSTVVWSEGLCLVPRQTATPRELDQFDQWTIQQQRRPSQSLSEHRYLDSTSACPARLCTDRSRGEAVARSRRSSLPRERRELQQDVEPHGDDARHLQLAWQPGPAACLDLRVPERSVHCTSTYTRDCEQAHFDAGLSEESVRPWLFFFVSSSLQLEILLTLYHCIVTMAESTGSTRFTLTSQIWRACRTSTAASLPAEPQITYSWASPSPP